MVEFWTVPVRLYVPVQYRYKFADGLADTDRESMLAAFGTAAILSSVPGYIVEPDRFDIVGTYKQSTLYNIVTANTTYTSGAPQLLDLHGTRYEQGFASGKLGGDAARENYDSLLDALLDTSTLAGKLEKAALEVVIDWQWSSTLSKAVPFNMVEELNGFADGCMSARPLDGQFCQHLVGRTQVLANAPGDVADVVYVLLDELPKAVASEAVQLLRSAQALRNNGRDDGAPSLRGWLGKLHWPLAQCSMFGVWGKRTAVAGQIFSGRNLDWNQDTGLDKWKIVTVYHPPDGHAHMTVGFGGLIGALAGMSAEGLTVHEANLESNLDSFRGFPWLLRLRHVMERASNLAEARSVWAETNNTVGFNHMIASAADQSALVIETNSQTSAYFSANDPREAAAAFPGPGGRIIHGAPMEDAVFRTNHGFDLSIVSHFMWNTTGAYNDSDHRYHLIADTIRSSAQPIGALDAVRLTALIGQKGPDYAACTPPFKGGCNVLSVATDPTNLIAYAAWEDGAGTGSEPGNWRPAACNAYIKLDMKRWFEGNGTQSSRPRES